MLHISLAGNLGRDAEHKTTTTGQDRCSFSVAVSVGFGENKSTVWVDVTRWGKGAEGLARILRKGSKVAVIGELSMREHNGKTYLQCRADNVTVLGTPQGDASKADKPSGGSGWGQGEADGDQGKGGFADDLDDSIPFATNDSIW